MRRTRAAGYGEVERAIPSGEQMISGLAVNERWIYFTARDGANATGLYRMAHDGASRTRVSALSAGAGLAFAGGELYAVGRAPGALHKVEPDGQSSKVCDLPVEWARGLAFDGANFWFLGMNPAQDLHGAYAVDAKSGEVKVHLESADADIRGIAAEQKAGGGRRWISSRSGEVYEVEPARIPKGGRLEAGIVRKFPGRYGQLSWYGGVLWGVDNEARRICEIRLE